MGGTSTANQMKTVNRLQGQQMLHNAYYHVSGCLPYYRIPTELMDLYDSPEPRERDQSLGHCNPISDHVEEVPEEEDSENRIDRIDIRSKYTKTQDAVENKKDITNNLKEQEKSNKNNEEPDADGAGGASGGTGNENAQISSVSNAIPSNTNQNAQNNQNSNGTGNANSQSQRNHSSKLITSVNEEVDKVFSFEGVRSIRDKLQSGKNGIGDLEKLARDYNEDFQRKSIYMTPGYEPTDKKMCVSKAGELLLHTLEGHINVVSLNLLNTKYTGSRPSEPNIIESLNCKLARAEHIKVAPSVVKVGSNITEDQIQSNKDTIANALNSLRNDNNIVNTVAIPVKVNDGYHTALVLRNTDRSIIAIYNDSFGKEMPAELRGLMQDGEHIASDIVYDQNILDLHICQQPINYIGNTGIQISQEKAINTLFNISRMEIDNLCSENIRQVLKHDSDLDTIHNLTGGEYHVVSRIATNTFDVVKLAAAFLLSNILHGYCMNPSTAASSAPTAPSPDDNIIGHLYPEDPLVGHLNLKIRSNLRGGYEEEDDSESE